MVPGNGIRRNAWPALAALALLAACSDDSVGPLDLAPSPSARASAAPGSSGLQLVANTVPYRQPRYEHATGRAGGATLTARALLGKDDRVSLELTTGVLDEPGATGSIDKVQWKIVSAEGRILDIANNRPATQRPTAAYQLDYLPRKTRIRVQANISGVDRKRTGVLTLEEQVNLRPDPAAVVIEAPAEAWVNTPISVSASFAELNGDIGARADCVLEADGTEVDRAKGIWIAESDIVECRFAHTFASAGSHQLTARLVDVRPGDWDVSNNAVSAQIQIVNQGTRLHGSAGAIQSTFTRDAHYQGELEQPNGTQVWDYRDHRFTGTQSAYLFAMSPESGAFPLRSIDIRHSTGGREVVRLTAANLVTEWVDGSFRCGHYLNGAAWARLCSLPGGTTLETGHSAGQATYYTPGALPGGGSDPRYVNGYYYGSHPVTFGQGSWANFGDDYAFSVQVDGARRFLADAEVRLQETPTGNDRLEVPWQCTTASNGYSCYELVHVWTYRLGRVVF